MSDEKIIKDPALIKIHLIGGLICLGVIAGAVWFATDSISKRRGLFLSARHELSTVRSDLDNAVKSRTLLASRAQKLEDATRDSLELISVRHLNRRTEELSRLCESVRVAVDTLQPEEMITDSRVPVQPLELAGSAAASDVNLLLERFDTEMPDIHIQSIEMMSESLGSSRVRLRMSLYWFVDPTSGS